MFLFLLSAVLMAQSKMVFETEVHDFGLILEDGGNVDYDFIFTNKGDKPIVVTRVSSSCGCTSPNWSKKPVKPRETGKISARYFPKHRPGQFSKTLTVFTNDPQVVKVLKIKGKVVKKLPGPQIVAYKEFYVYKSVAKEIKDKQFEKFVASVKKYLDEKEQLTLKIESSASNAPINKRANNGKEIQKKAKIFEKRIKKSLKEAGVDISKIKFTSPLLRVQGPAYPSGKDIEKETFAAYQYVKVDAVYDK